MDPFIVYVAEPYKGPEGAVYEGWSEGRGSGGLRPQT